MWRAPPGGSSKIATSPSRRTSSWMTTRSAPCGHRRAGEDAHAVARRRARRRSRAPAKDSPIDPQPRGHGEIGVAHRIAVHRRHVGGRRAHPGAYRLAQHAAEGVADGDALAPDRPGGGHDQGNGLVERDHCRAIREDGGTARGQSSISTARKRGKELNLLSRPHDMAVGHDRLVDTGAQQSRF